MERGAKLGPYEILGPLGAGGMGEVYKARDTRLNRTVAVKVLSSKLSVNPELRERLHREAHTVSSLNHPHICALYDIGDQSGVDYLVLEFIEGETLADRLTKGALPLDTALRYASEMASALDHAHSHGVVHRDLKPGNVMLTKSGTKLLDFGLAKFRSQGIVAADETAPLTRNLTGEGKIVGTLQYMAPEQLEGKEADSRSDMFAFGAVLYEMVTGHVAFEGSTHASLIASILKSDPVPVSKVQPVAPVALDRLIASCLAKDPDHRWQSAGDLGRALKWVDDGPGAAPPAVAPRAKPYALLAITAAALLALAGLSWLHFRQRVPDSQSVRFTLPTEAMLPAQLSISPDGTHVAYTGQNAQGVMVLWLRSLDKLHTTAIPGTDGAEYPFWSPDGRQIAFFSARKLMKIDVAGGQPRTLCEGLTGNFGGDWGRDGTILFSADGNIRKGIFRVSSNGGEATAVTTPENPDVGHSFPKFLPDGKHFIYLSRGVKFIEMVASLDSKQVSTLAENQSNATISLGLNGSPSYLLFGRDNALMAQEINASSFKLAGDPFRVVDTVATEGRNGFADMSASANGALVYNSASYSYELVWLDRSGTRVGSTTPADRYTHPKLTADGKQAVFELAEPGSRNFAVWKLNVERGEASLLHKNASASPVPFPDGSSVVFGCVIEGHSKICRKAIGGAGAIEVLWDSSKPAWPVDISADARFMSFAHTAPATVWILPLTGDRKAYRFDPSESYQRHGIFSPNVKFIAYTTNETGEMEVYVQPFPATGEKWKVSSHGGAQPRWRGDGRELFYRTANGKMMAVPVKTNGQFESGLPIMLFQWFADPLYPNLTISYDVTADGQKFLINSAVDFTKASPITVITNWRAAVKR